MITSFLPKVIPVKLNLSPQYNMNTAEIATILSEAYHCLPDPTWEAVGEPNRNSKLIISNAAIHNAKMHMVKMAKLLIEQSQGNADHEVIIHILRPMIPPTARL